MPELIQWFLRHPFLTTNDFYTKQGDFGPRRLNTGLPSDDAPAKKRYQQRRKEKDQCL